MRPTLEWPACTERDLNLSYYATCTEPAPEVQCPEVDDRLHFLPFACVCSRVSLLLFHLCRFEQWENFSSQHKAHTRGRCARVGRHQRCEHFGVSTVSSICHCHGIVRARKHNGFARDAYVAPVCTCTRCKLATVTPLVPLAVYYVAWLCCAVPCLLLLCCAVLCCAICEGASRLKHLSFFAMRLLLI